MKKIILIFLFISSVCFSQWNVWDNNKQWNVWGVQTDNIITGYTYEPETTNYFATLSGTYDDNYKKSLDTLIKTLKTFYAHNPADSSAQSDTTLLDRLDRFYNLMTANGDDALIELKNRESMDLVNAPEFWAYRGYNTRITEEKCIDTKFNAKTDGVNFKKEYASVLVDIDTNVNANTCDYGGNDGTVYSYMYANWDSKGKLYFSLNGNETTGEQPTSSSLYMFLMVRNKTKAMIYKNGVYDHNNDNTNTNPMNVDAYLGGYNNNGSLLIPSDRRYTFHAVGGYFSNRDAIIIYEAINKFKTYVKANY
jgi:hypothetical protein